jgi:formyl-CoA transferase
MPGVIPKLSGTPGRVEWVGPELGEHTREVLSGLGLTGAEIDALKAAGTV